MLTELNSLVQEASPSVSVLDFLQYLQARWVSAQGSQSHEFARREDFENLITKQKVDWGNWRWHLRNRLEGNRDLDLFLKLFPQFQGKKDDLEQYLEWYNLSILPLNLVAGDGVLNFLPEVGQQLKPDPYGIRRGYSTVTRRDKDGKLWYLATRKPEYATFLFVMNVSCPIGCARCYRGYQTRHRKPFTLIYDDDSEEKLYLPGPVKQLEWLVERWNSEEQFKGVYDILVSGGEPLMAPDRTIKQLLSVAAEAKYLKAFRICTGTLFLGLPFRFGDELISLLLDFKESTGKQVGINAHIAHPDQMTPEAVYSAGRLSNAGFDLMAQTPLIEGVNVWQDDLERTVETLRRLDQLVWFNTGRRPYKWIVDMQKSVSVLTAIEVYRRVHDRHQVDSDTTRPTSFALFIDHPTGNINLSYHSLWAMKMQVDTENGRVLYQIPHPAGNWIEYEEPLMPGVNDTPEALERLKKAF